MEPQNQQQPPTQSAFQNPQPVTQSTLQTETKKPKSNIFTIVLILLILALAGAAGYLGYQNMQLQQKITDLKKTVLKQETPHISTSDLIAGWKIYTNQKYSIEFRYPESAQSSLQKTTTDEDYLVINSHIFFIISDTDSKDCQGVCPTIDKIENTEINSVDFEKIYSTPAEDQAWIAGIVPETIQLQTKLEDNKFAVFTLGLENIHTDNSELLAQFDQILSTFEFTNQADTTNWKTYTSTQYGVIFDISDSDLVTTNYVSFEEKVKQHRPAIFLSNQPHYSSQVEKCETTTVTKDCLVKAPSWQQTNDIEITNLGGKQARSYFINDYLLSEPVHVVETTTQPYVQISQVVGGSGLEEQFMQLLTTFEFTN